MIQLNVNRIIIIQQE